MKYIIAPIILLLFNLLIQSLVARFYPEINQSIILSHVFLIFLAIHLLGIFWLIIGFNRISGITKVEFILLIVLVIMVTVLVFGSNLVYYRILSEPQLSLRLR
ncbi:MAG: hypothetical protein JXB60_09955 [Candidatus Cloacimonetes bacterium]|nr:hypothetical protein [Candidatus Cloacimonadota bacterium]